MVGGIEAQRGYQYQNLVGVYRVIESFIHYSKPEYVEFESVNEILEDINIFYRDRVILEQVKKKENSLWTASEIKPILSKFALKYPHLSKSYKNVVFRFTTNAYYNNSINALIEMMYILKKQGREKNLLKINQYFNDEIEIELQIEVLKRLQFFWNFCSFEDHLHPFKRIQESCENLFCGYEKELSSKPQEVVIKLYNQVCEFASSKSENKRKYTLQDFHESTGLMFLSRDNIKKMEELLGKEIFDTIQELRPSILYINSLYEGSNIQYICFYVKKIRFIIFIVDDYVTDNDIWKIEKYIEKTNEKDTIYIIIINAKRIKRSHFRLNNENIIIINQDIKRFNAVIQEYL